VGTTPKKRKRPVDQDDDKVHNAKINLDKLMDRLKGEDNARERPKRKRHKGKTQDIGQGYKADQGQESTNSEKKPVRKKNNGQKDESSLTLKETKGSKRKKAPDNLHASLSSERDESHDAINPPASNGLTTLQHRMKQSLDGARFRWINEMLYKSNSERAVEMMHKDPTMFQEYHTGFRNQVRAWPSNPVAHYASILGSYPARTVIADLGCGDAALACSLTSKGMIVHSYDLVSDGIYVVEADICDKLPLPGSEGIDGEASEGEGHIVDVAVCALSLMGSNWPKCVREVWRILKPGGEFKIAEVTSRFVNVDQFLSLVSSIGFKLKSKDESNSHFVLLEFKKVARKAKSEREWEKIMSKGNLLKPCEYKRR